MTRYHKPSSWNAGQWNFTGEIEEAVKQYYPPDVMAKIIKGAHLGEIIKDQEKQAELEKMIERNIIALGVWTVNRSHLAKRPKPAQRRAALKKIEKAANGLNKLLATLDDDSMDDLRRTMLADPFCYQALLPDPTIDLAHPLFGRAKYQTLLNVSQKLELWAAKAQHIKTRKDGDKLADEKRWFVEGLIKIWIKIGYEKPTLVGGGAYGKSKTSGPLMDFVTLAAAPMGFRSMEATLREGIDLWKKGQKHPRKSPLSR